MISPSMGVRSSLKSPVWITVPTGVVTARQQASAIEWLTLMNSTDILPAVTTSPASTQLRRGVKGS